MRPQRAQDTFKLAGPALLQPEDNSLQNKKSFFYNTQKITRHTWSEFELSAINFVPLVLCFIHLICMTASPDSAIVCCKRQDDIFKICHFIVGMYKKKEKWLKIVTVLSYSRNKLRYAKWIFACWC